MSIVEMFEAIRRDAERRSASIATSRATPAPSPRRPKSGGGAFLVAGAGAAGAAIGAVAAPAKVSPMPTPIPTPTTPPVPDISGRWAFGFAGIPVSAGAYIMTLQQSGTTFTGGEVELGAPFASVTGTISPSGRFTLVEHRLNTVTACDVDAQLQDARNIVGTAYCNCCPQFVTYPAALQKID